MYTSNIQANELDKYIPRHIFIHFLDHEIFHTFGLDKRDQHLVAREFQFAFRIALLLAEDGIIIPASHFYESTLSRAVLDSHRIFAEFGYLNLAANTLDVNEFLLQKQLQYKIERERYPLYFEEKPTLVESDARARWILKVRDSTKDITTDWNDSIGKSETWERVYKHSKSPSILSFEKELSLVPERLEQNAFIADFVTPLLDLHEQAHDFTNKYIGILIQRAYIDSFLKTYGAACLDDFILFDTSSLLPKDKSRYSLARAKRFFYTRGLLDFITFSDAAELLNFKLSEQWIRDIKIFCSYTFLNFIKPKALFADSAELRRDDHQLIQKETHRRPGRPHLSDDIWAWEEVNLFNRQPPEVYNEWIHRPGVEARYLTDPIRQFKRVIKTEWRRTVE